MKTITSESDSKVILSTEKTEDFLVSILISSYNYGRYLSQAIDSALNQTYGNVEVIVVDDGSTDSSSELIKSYGDQVIAVLKENGGQASAMNAGFAASSGKVICLLDADDLFLPEKVSYVADLFQENPDIDWVFNQSARLDATEINAEDLADIFQKVRVESCQTQLDKIDFRRGVIKGKIPDFPPSTSNLCFSRRIMEKIFPLPEVKGVSGVAISDLYIHTLAIGLSTGYSTKQDFGIYRCHEINVGSSFQIKRRRAAEININTGYWIRKNFPQFKHVSNKFLSRGYATYLSTCYAKSRELSIIREEKVEPYLNDNSLFMKLKVSLMVLYYWIKLRFKEFV